MFRLAVVFLIAYIVSSQFAWALDEKDARTLLGVSDSATENDIKTSYRRLAMRFHPDRLPVGSSDEVIRINEQNFKKVKEAYEFLT